MQRKTSSSTSASLQSITSHWNNELTPNIVDDSVLLRESYLENDIIQSEDDSGKENFEVLQEISSLLLLVHDNYLKNMVGRDITTALTKFLHDIDISKHICVLHIEKMRIYQSKDMNRTQSAASQFSYGDDTFGYESFFDWLRHVAMYIFPSLDSYTQGKNAIHHMIVEYIVPRISLWGENGEEYLQSISSGAAHEVVSTEIARLTDHALSNMVKYADFLVYWFGHMLFEDEAMYHDLSSCELWKTINVRSPPHQHGLKKIHNRTDKCSITTILKYFSSDDEDIESILLLASSNEYEGLGLMEFLYAMELRSDRYESFHDQTYPLRVTMESQAVNQRASALISSRLDYSLTSIVEYLYYLTLDYYILSIHTNTLKLSTTNSISTEFTHLKELIHDKQWSALIYWIYSSEIGLLVNYNLVQLVEIVQMLVNRLHQQRNIPMIMNQDYIIYLFYSLLQYFLQSSNERESTTTGKWSIEYVMQYTLFWDVSTMRKELQDGSLQEFTKKYNSSTNVQSYEYITTSVDNSIYYISLAKYLPKLLFPRKLQISSSMRDLTSSSNSGNDNSSGLSSENIHSSHGNLPLSILYMYSRESMKYWISLQMTMENSLQKIREYYLRRYHHNSDSNNDSSDNNSNNDFSSGIDVASEDYFMIMSFFLIENDEYCIQLLRYYAYIYARLLYILDECQQYQTNTKSVNKKSTPNTIEMIINTQLKFSIQAILTLFIGSNYSNNRSNNTDNQQKKISIKLLLEMIFTLSFLIIRQNRQYSSTSNNTTAKNPSRRRNHGRKLDEEEIEECFQLFQFFLEESTLDYIHQLMRDSPSKSNVWNPILTESENLLLMKIAYILQYPDISQWLHLYRYHQDQERLEESRLLQSLQTTSITSSSVNANDAIHGVSNISIPLQEWTVLLYHYPYISYDFNPWAILDTLKDLEDQSTTNNNNSSTSNTAERNLNMLKKVGERYHLTIQDLSKFFTSFQAYYSNDIHGGPLTNTTSNNAANNNNDNAALTISAIVRGEFFAFFQSPTAMKLLALNEEILRFEYSRLLSHYTNNRQFKTISDPFTDGCIFPLIASNTWSHTLRGRLEVVITQNMALHWAMDMLSNTNPTNSNSNHTTTTTALPLTREEILEVFQQTILLTDLTISDGSKNNYHHHHLTYSTFIIFATRCYTYHLFQRHPHVTNTPAGSKERHFLEGLRKMLTSFSMRLTKIQQRLQVKLLIPLYETSFPILKSPLQQSLTQRTSGSNGNNSNKHAAVVNIQYQQNLLQVSSAIFQQHLTSNTLPSSLLQQRKKSNTKQTTNTSTLSGNYLRYYKLPPRPPVTLWDAPRFLEFCKLLGILATTSSAYQYQPPTNQQQQQQLKQQLQQQQHMTVSTSDSSSNINSLLYQLMSRGGYHDTESIYESILSFINPSPSMDESNRLEWLWYSFGQVLLSQGPEAIESWEKSIVSPLPVPIVPLNTIEQQSNANNSSNTSNNIHILLSAAIEMKKKQKMNSLLEVLERMNASTVNSSRVTDQTEILSTIEETFRGYEEVSIFYKQITPIVAAVMDKIENKNTQSENPPVNSPSNINSNSDWREKLIRLFPGSEDVLFEDLLRYGGHELMQELIVNEDYLQLFYFYLREISQPTIVSNGQSSSQSKVIYPYKPNRNTNGLQLLFGHEVAIHDMHKVLLIGQLMTVEEIALEIKQSLHHRHRPYCILNPQQTNPASQLSPNSKSSNTKIVQVVTLSYYEVQEVILRCALFLWFKYGIQGTSTSSASTAPTTNSNSDMEVLAFYKVECQRVLSEQQQKSKEKQMATANNSGKSLLSTWGINYLRPYLAILRKYFKIPNKVLKRFQQLKQPPNNSNYNNNTNGNGSNGNNSNENNSSNPPNRRDKEYNPNHNSKYSTNSEGRTSYLKNMLALTATEHNKTSFNSNTSDTTNAQISSTGINAHQQKTQNNNNNNNQSTSSTSKQEALQNIIASQNLQHNIQQNLQVHEPFYRTQQQFDRHAAKKKAINQLPPPIPTTSSNTLPKLPILDHNPNSSTSNNTSNASNKSNNNNIPQQADQRRVFSFQEYSNQLNPGSLPLQANTVNSSIDATTTSTSTSTLTNNENKNTSNFNIQASTESNTSSQNSTTLSRSSTNDSRQQSTATTKNLSLHPPKISGVDPQEVEKSRNTNNIIHIAKESLWPVFATYCSCFDSRHPGQLSGPNLFTLLSKLNLLSNPNLVSNTGSMENSPVMDIRLSEIILLFHQVARHAYNFETLQSIDSRIADIQHHESRWYQYIDSVTDQSPHSLLLSPSLSFEEFLVFLHIFAHLRVYGEYLDSSSNTGNKNNSLESRPGLNNLQINSMNVSSRQNSTMSAHQQYRHWWKYWQEEMQKSMTFAKLLHEQILPIVQRQFLLAFPEDARLRDNFQLLFSWRAWLAVESIERGLSDFYLELLQSSSTRTSSQNMISPSNTSNNASSLSITSSPEIMSIVIALKAIHLIPAVIEEEQVLQLIKDVLPKSNANQSNNSSLYNLLSPNTTGNNNLISPANSVTSQMSSTSNKHQKPTVLLLFPQWQWLLSVIAYQVVEVATPSNNSNALAVGGSSCKINDNDFDAKNLLNTSINSNDDSVHAVPIDYEELERKAHLVGEVMRVISNAIVNHNSIE